MWRGNNLNDNQQYNEHDDKHEHDITSGQSGPAGLVGL
jgi:hypothetical protein